MVVSQESTEPFPTADWAISRDFTGGQREQDDVALPLVWSFDRIVRVEFAERPAKRCFPEQDHLGQALTFYAEHPALRVGVQVRASCGKLHWLHAGGLKDLVELLGELRVPIAEQVEPRLQKPIVGHGDVASDLCHPSSVGSWRKTSDVNSASGDMDEEEHVVGYQPALGPRPRS